MTGSTSFQPNVLVNVFKMEIYILKQIKKISTAFVFMLQEMKAVTKALNTPSASSSSISVTIEMRHNPPPFPSITMYFNGDAAADTDTTDAWCV